MFNRDPDREFRQQELMLNSGDLRYIKTQLNVSPSIDLFALSRKSQLSDFVPYQPDPLNQRH